MKEKLGFRAKGREVVGRNGSFELRESSAAYRSILGPENAAIRPQNQYHWEDIRSIST
jgi:putative transposase